jgi:hypothetical protein
MIRPALESNWKSFVGERRVGRPGKPDFIISLYEDSAAKNSGLQSGGKCEYVNGDARITWGDTGWRNFIRPDGQGFQKVAFGPGKSFDDPPTDTAAAEKIQAGR